MTGRGAAATAAVAAGARQVLLVEDEADLARLVKRHVDEAGFEVRHVASGERALQALTEQDFDLILLDIMLPGMDGLEVCRRIRAQGLTVPVLMLTARSSEVDKVLGLEVGADDYLTKPFGLMELIARVRAIFRRLEMQSAPGGEDGVMRLGEHLRIDVRSREVSIRGTPVALTRKEFDLLLHFARNPGRVYTRSQLLDTIWGYNPEGDEHAVNCHINRLRSKVERDPSEPELLLTVWGVGYKFAGGARE